jgi:transposase
MKKISTVAAKQSRNFSQPNLTIGLDLCDRSSWYCVRDEAGAIVLEQKLGTIPKAMKEVFGATPRCRIALETGMHSPWVSRALSELGLEMIVAHARNLRLIGESRKKNDRIDAQTMARLARIDPQLLRPVRHWSAKSTSGSVRDPGASRTGASTNGAGEHSPRVGQKATGSGCAIANCSERLTSM